MPSQWLIIGGLALPLIMCAADFVLEMHDAIEESMAILPMLASGLAVALYVAPFAAGTPLWSRTLAGTTVFMTFVTLSPIGIDGAATTSMGDTAMLSVLFAASMVPLLAAAGNVLQTARSNWGKASANPAATAVLIGMIMTVGSAIGHLFVGSDAHSAGEIQYLSTSMNLSLIHI